MFILIAHLVSTAMMAGLIWFVQVVHYPLMRAVMTSEFPMYSQNHVRLTGYVVAPLMLIELATAVWLIFITPSETPIWLWLINLATILFLWLSTFLIQVPIHNKLVQGRDEAAIDKLVRTNWIRTILWTSRVVFLCFVVFT